MWVLDKVCQLEKEYLPIIDIKNLIETNEDKSKINFKNGDIEFKDINFNYSSNLENKVLNKLI